MTQKKVTLVVGVVLNLIIGLVMAVVFAASAALLSFFIINDVAGLVFLVILFYLLAPLWYFGFLYFLYKKVKYGKVKYYYLYTYFPLLPFSVISFLLRLFFG